MEDVLIVSETHEFTGIGNQIPVVETDNDAEYIRIMTTERDKQAQLNYARSQGLEEGLAKGKLETARKLKAEGIAIDVIAKCTGLTEEQIAKL